MAGKVLLLEINEITWDLIDPFIEQGKLPTFARLKREGAFGSPMSVDLPPYLDPWITWTTVYSGRPQAEHNVSFLQQPPETILAKRIWEYCNEAGLNVGVYGSLCSWPPPAVNGGYIVPDTFSQDFSTYPAGLEPIQKLNLTYTRSIRLPSDDDGMLFKAKLGLQLARLGLKPSTMASIASQLVRERLNPNIRWQRVVLQPMVNFDFFSKLYRRRGPDFATFHTNHVAHYMHTYWKAMEPKEFEPLETSEKERAVYGSAIEYGYQAADRLLGKVLGLLDDDTTLVVASSMGQQPYRSKLSRGKRIGQLRSLDRLLELLDCAGQARAVSMMSDQFNIYVDDPETLHEVEKKLTAAYIDQPELKMFTVEPADGALTATLSRRDEIRDDSQCVFPLSDNTPSVKYDELVYESGVVKSGCHHPKGMLMLYGAGVRAGAKVEDCNNLDLAPTMMTLLGLEIPDVMKGRVLSEAFESLPDPRPSATAAPVGAAG